MLHLYYLISYNLLGEGAAGTGARCTWRPVVAWPPVSWRAPRCLSVPNPGHHGPPPSTGPPQRPPAKGSTGLLTFEMQYLFHWVATPSTCCRFLPNAQSRNEQVCPFSLMLQQLFPGPLQRGTLYFFTIKVRVVDWCTAIMHEKGRSIWFCLL